MHGRNSQDDKSGNAASLAEAENLVDGHPEHHIARHTHTNIKLSIVMLYLNLHTDTCASEPAKTHSHAVLLVVQRKSVHAWRASQANHAEQGVATVTQPPLCSDGLHKDYCSWYGSNGLALTPERGVVASEV